MAEFLTSVDIANRALQHCGAEMIDSSLGFSEVSKRARQTSFAYGKLRRAELRHNIWKFATRRAVLRAIDANTMLLAPALWVSSTTYFTGSIVSDQYNNLWISRVPNNLNNNPASSTLWEPYFGPMSVMLYDTSTTYVSGELVYTAAGNGTYRVYLSLQSDNSDNPATATAWDATVTYFKNQVVTYSSVAYMSLIDLNLNQTPSASAANWASGTTYAINALVNGSDSITYKSLGNGNIAHDPTTDGGVHWQNTSTLTAWTTVFTGGAGSLKWLQIGGTEFPSGVALSALNFSYPVGAGPSSQDATRNIFRVPSGFLRMAPQDPKAGATSYLGAPSGLAYKDWLLENDLIVTADVGPIMIRFVVDMSDVTRMDDLFCEGLAARIALEVCEPLTQSSEKLKTIAGLYSKFISEARTANAIEVGAEEPPEDDYITTRI